MSLVPAVIDSERAVLGTVLAEPSLFGKVVSELAIEDFYPEHHRVLWSAMIELHEQGGLDAIALYEYLRLKEPRHLQQLSELSAMHADTTLDWHIDKIRNATAVRELMVIGNRLMQRAPTIEDPVTLAEDSIEQLRIVQRTNAAETSTVIDFTDLVARVVDEDEFVVPGLLAAKNRIMITSPEGYGKSSLLRQIGTCAAAGVHPFHVTGRCRTARTVIFDAENPEEINTVEYQRVHDALREYGRLPDRGMLTIDECGPMNLLDPRQAARCYALVERIRPELIIIGPIYQLHEDNPNDEGPARKLSAVLDRMRRISGAAMVVEAHTPHSDGPGGQLLRPFGASLWKRWPEFGYCLHPVVTARRNHELSAEEQQSQAMRESYFTAWRGSRARRNWPTRLCMGSYLPWGTY